MSQITKVSKPGDLSEVDPLNLGAEPWKLREDMSNWGLFVDDIEEVIDYIQQRFCFVLKTIAVLSLSVCSIVALAQRGSSSDAGSSSTSVPGNPASLQVKGTVSINQRPVSDLTATVFAGDRIATANGAVARISAPGLSIYVPENSCVKYNGRQLELCNCGSVDVNAVGPVRVSFPAREIVVTSEGANAAFAMSAAGGDLEISSRQGTTAISKSGLVLTKLGSSAPQSFAGLGCPDPRSAERKLEKTAATGTAAAWTAIALTAPAVLTATVLARNSKRAPLSSSNP